VSFKKVLSILVVTFVIFNFGRIIYSDFVKSKPQEDLRSNFEKHFTDGDERIKMVWFSAQGKTISIALEIAGLGENPKNIEKIKQNSKAYITEKVCSTPQLKQFVKDGNYISVDIRNEDANYANVQNIMNITMSAKQCV
jgi:hypothetical protein